MKTPEEKRQQAAERARKYRQKKRDAASRVTRDAEERTEKEEEKERSKEKEEEKEKKDFEKENPKEKGVTHRGSNFLFPELSEPEKEAGNKAEDWKARESDFHEFWKVWPRKVAKAEAQKAFASLARQNKLPPLADLCAAVKTQTAILEWARENFRFCPHPSTWLRAMRWQDEVGGVKTFAAPRRSLQPPPRIPERQRQTRHVENQTERPQNLQKNVSSDKVTKKEENANFEAALATTPKLQDEHLDMIARCRRREAVLAEIVDEKPVRREDWLEIPEIQRAVFLRKYGITENDILFV